MILAHDPESTHPNLPFPASFQAQPVPTGPEPPGPPPSLGFGLGTFSYAFGLGFLFPRPSSPPPLRRPRPCLWLCPQSLPAWSPFTRREGPSPESESESSDDELEESEDDSSLDSSTALGAWYMQHTILVN